MRHADVWIWEGMVIVGLGFAVSVEDFAYLSFVYTSL